MFLRKPLQISLALSTGRATPFLNEMRDDGLLDEYERGDEAFTDFVAEVIGETFYEYDWIEQSTQRFDHKRGWTDLSMELSAPLGHFKRISTTRIHYRAGLVKSVTATATS